ncbi:MAG: NADP-dependent succinate-semialdehyde dehydrogenase [Herpetosiphon sp.]
MVEQLMHEQLMIGGQRRPATGGKTLEVRNPATAEVIGEVADGTVKDVEHAIDVAAAAQDAWQKRPAKERGAILRRVYDLMMEHKEAIARLITLENGKPLSEARAETEYAADFIGWFGEEAKRVDGQMIPASVANRRLLVMKQAIGVSAAITPWNFPAAMITRKIGPALAAGCTMIVKPPKQTPFTCFYLARLFEEAELPAGVLNIVSAGKAAMVSQALFGDLRVRKLSFTGSTEVGKELIRGSAEHVTRLSLELGGQAPLIVFDDADLEQAVKGAVIAKMRNTGQSCIAANRLYVQAGIAEAFTERFVEAVRAMKVGNGLDDGVQVGPVIDEPALEKLDRHVQDAVQRGADVRLGGKRARQAGSGYFYEPTVLVNVDDAALPMHEETFGPVAPLRVFRHEDEAVRLANDSPFGLAAYFFTEDVNRVFRVSEALDYGIIGVNEGLVSTAQAPFGGMKESGYGREGGHAGIEEYLETKYVAIGLR